MIFYIRQRSRWLQNRVCRSGPAAAAALIFFTAVTTLHGPAAEIEPTPFNTTLASVVGRLIPRLHYSGLTLDSALSDRLFDEYFSALDRNRRFFLASDIAEFENRRDRLHSLIMAGDLSFPYQVFNRYIQRVEERVDFVRAVIQEPFDYDTDEVVLIDRSEEPWPRTTEELDEIWRRQVMNRLIIYKMMEKMSDSEPEAEEKNEADDSQNQAEESGQRHQDLGDGDEDQPDAPDTDASVFRPQPPEQRVVAHYERMLKQLQDSESIDVLEFFLNALARIYDPHSTYMPPTREEDFEIDMSLSLEGIGAVLSTDEGYVKVVEIIPGGPADRDGSLQVGDRIVGVSRDGEMVDVINMSLQRVVRMIRGPKGTEVELQVLEAGRGPGALPASISLVRDEVQLTEQQARGELHSVPLTAVEEEGREDPAGVQEDGSAEAEEGEPHANVLFLSLPSFYVDLKAMREGEENFRRASRDIEETIDRFSRKGPIDGMVIDLRYNSGGSLDEAIKVAALFLDGGPVVQVRSAGNEVNILYAEEDQSRYDGPLVVMVNRLSASASEIVAAAIQDYGRGIIVGDSGTYGKGTVQNIYDLNRFFMHHPFFSDERAGSLKFTMAKYYRVSGGSVQKKGVIPDIILPAFTDHMEIGEANLDGALPWQRIDPLIDSAQVQQRWLRHLPVLEEQSRSRVEKSAEFQKIEKLIARYQEVRELETRPLNLARRRQLHEEEEEWFATIRTETMPRHRRPEEADDNSNDRQNEKPERNDPHKEETLRLIADLIRLDRKSDSGPRL